MTLLEELFARESFMDLLFNEGRDEIEVDIFDYIIDRDEKAGTSIKFDEEQEKKKLDNKEITQEEYDDKSRDFDIYEEKVESQAMQAYTQIFNDFPLVKFLEHVYDDIKNSSENEDRAENSQLLTSDSTLTFDNNVGGEIEFSSVFIINDKDDKKEYLTATEIQKRIKTYLLNKFKMINKINNRGEFIKDLLETLRKVVKVPSTTQEALSKKANIEYFDKSREARLKDIFGKFRLGNTKLNMKTFFKLENPAMSSLRIVGTLTEEQLEDAKDLLTRSYAGQKAKQVKPLIEFLDKRIEGKDSFSVESEKIELNIDTDKFIGSLDLKKVSRRDSIYQYWNKQRKDFKTVKISIENFQKELKDVYDNFDDNANREVKTLFKEVIDFNVNEYGKDSLNYIVAIEAKSIKRLNKDDRNVQAFTNLGKFIEESKISELGLGGDSKRQSSEDIGDKDTSSSKRERKDLQQASDRAGDYAVQEESEKYGGKSEYEEMAEEDKSSRASATYSKNKDFQGFTSDIQIEGTTGRGMTGVTNKLDVFNRESGELIDTIVDPLFAYAFLTQKDVFKNLAMFKSELEKLERRLQTLSNVGKTMELEIDFDDDITKYIEELQELVISDRKEFYLPISPEFNKIMDGFEYEKMDARIDYIKEFLILITKFIEFGSKSEQSSQDISISISADGGKKNPALDITELGKTNTRNLFKELGESKKAFEKMLDDIVDYYVIPTSMQYRPFNSQIKILSTKTKAILTKAKSEEQAFFHLLSKYASGGSIATLFPSGNFSVITKITDLLKFITTSSIFTDKDELASRLKSLKAELIFIYSPQFEDIIEEELNAYYYGTLRRTLNAQKRKELKLFGKNSKDMYERVRDKPQVYPLHAFIDIIRNNETRLNALVNKENDFDKNTLQEFTSRMKKFTEKIVKSQDEIILLEAHDEIRKMLDKPVYYTYGDVGDFTDVSNTIDILKSKFNVDVSALDIENIVKETDSMQNLGLKYGISSESVYFVKANFR